MLFLITNASYAYDIYDCFKKKMGNKGKIMKTNLGLIFLFLITTTLSFADEVKKKDIANCSNISGAHNEQTSEVKYKYIVRKNYSDGKVEFITVRARKYSDNNIFEILNNKNKINFNLSPSSDKNLISQAVVLSPQSNESLGDYENRYKNFKDNSCDNWLKEDLGGYKRLEATGLIKPMPTFEEYSKNPDMFNMKLRSITTSLQKVGKYCEEVSERYVICEGVKYVRGNDTSDNLRGTVKAIEERLKPEPNDNRIESVSK